MGRQSQRTSYNSAKLAIKLTKRCHRCSTILDSILKAFLQVTEKKELRKIYVGWKMANNSPEKCVNLEECLSPSTKRLDVPSSPLLMVGLDRLNLSTKNVLPFGVHR